MSILDRWRRDRNDRAPGAAEVQPHDRAAHADDQVSEGVAVRVALEHDDQTAAAAAATRLRAARAHAQHREPSPAFDRVDPLGLRVPYELACYTDLGLPELHTLEARAALAIANGAWLDAASGLVAVYLRLPADAPLWWRQFEHERRLYMTAGAPYMWRKYPAVLAGDPQPVPEAAAALSADAAAVLAYPKLVRRRQLVDIAHLRARTFLPEPRITAALDELQAAGFANTPTLPERLGQLTAAELRTLLPDAPGKGSKPQLVQAVLAGGDRMIEQLKVTHPEVLDADLVSVGLGLGKHADWLLHFCELAAHWLQFQHFAERDRRELATNTVLAGYDIAQVDDCAVCRPRVGIVTRRSQVTLPPFHIGCRCGTLPRVS